MKILQEQPPFISEARDVFRLPEGTVFTFSDIIYNPSGRPIDEHLYAHEELHGKQQGDKPQEWWQRYLKDKDFRLSQELPAYQVQYQSVKKISKDRNKLHNYATLLAKDLSSEMYGHLITFHEALSAIKRPELYKFKV